MLHKAEKLNEMQIRICEAALNPKEEELNTLIISLLNNAGGEREIENALKYLVESFISNNNIDNNNNNSIESSKILQAIISIFKCIPQGPFYEKTIKDTISSLISNNLAIQALLILPNGVRAIFCDKGEALQTQFLDAMKVIYDSVRKLQRLSYWDHLDELHHSKRILYHYLDELKKQSNFAGEFEFLKFLVEINKTLKWPPSHVNGVKIYLASTAVESDKKTFSSEGQLLNRADNLCYLMAEYKCSLRVAYLLTDPIVEKTLNDFLKGCYVLIHEFKITLPIEIYRYMVSFIVNLPQQLEYLSLLDTFIHEQNKLYANNQKSWFNFFSQNISAEDLQIYNTFRPSQKQGPSNAQM